MDLTDKIKDNSSFFVDVIKGAMPTVGIGLALIMGYMTLNACANKAPRSLAERAPIIDTINYDFYAPLDSQGDEYNECREIRDALPITEKVDLIFRGDHMFDFNFPSYVPKTNVPELRPAPEKTPSKQKYQRQTNSKGQLYSKTPKLPNTRGVRNNNFGNIRIIPGKEWAGQRGRDGNFCRFKSPEYGLRAIAKNLRDKEDRYGDKTIRAIVKSWAPSSDGNNTNGYIADVSKLTGYHPDQELDLTNRETLISLIAAISKRDSGAAFPKETYARAIAMLPAEYIR